MRIRLFLLGFKGYYLIKNLPRDYINQIESVIIARDPGIENDYFGEIQEECLKRDIKYFERNSEPKIDSCHFILIGWRWIVPTTNQIKLIIFHDSLLPRYRGFNPLVTALINGDTKIGATCLFGTEEYDRGDIIDQKSIEINYPIKIKDAIEKIAEIYSALFINVADSLRQNSITAYPQNNSIASYSLWRNEEDYFINWDWDAARIERFVNAVGFPYLGARTRINEQVVIIKNVKVEPGDVLVENRDAGKVIFKTDQSVTIVCGNGLVSVNEFYCTDGSLYNLKDKFRIKFK